MNLFLKLAKPKSLRFTLLSGLILFTSVLFFFLNSLLDDRMGSLKNELLALFNDFSGRTLSYSSISPSVLQYFEIRDLVINNKKESGSNTLLRIKNLKIHYNIFKLLFNPDPLSAIHEINIEHSEFNLDMIKEKELALALKEFIMERLKQKIAFDFKITGSDIRVSIYDTDYNFYLSQLFFSVENNKDIYEYRVRGRLKADTIEQNNSSFLFDTEMNFGGKIDKEFTWFDMVVDILSTEADNFTLAEQKFQVSMQEDLLSINKIQDHTPIDITCNYNLKSEILLVNFISENWKPAYLLQFKKSLSEYNPWLETSIYADAELEYHFPDHAMNYSLDIRAALLSNKILSSFSFNTTIKGDGNIAYLEPINIESNGSKAEFRGNVLIANLFPAGKLSLRDIHTGYTGAITGDFEIKRADKGFSLLSNSFTLGKTDFNAFTLVLYPNEKQIAFDLDSSLNESPKAAGIKSKGRFKFGYALQFDSEWTLVNMPLNELYSILTDDKRQSPYLYANLKDYIINSKLQFQTDFDDLNLVSEEIKISDEKNSNNSLFFDLAFQHNHIQSKKYRGSWFGLPLAGDINVDLVPTNSYDFATLFTVNGVPYKIEGFIIPTQGIVLGGSYGLDASLLFGKEEDIRFWLKTNKLPLSVNNNLFYVSLNCLGFIDANGNWQLSSMHSKLFNLPVAKEYTPENYLDLFFILTEKELELKEVSYYDKISEIKGNGHFDIDSFSPFMCSGWFYLENKDSDESYKTELKLLPESMDLNLSFHNTPIKRLGNFIVKGKLSGNIKAVGSFSNPLVDVYLSLQDGKLHNSPFSGDISFSMEEDFFRLNSLQCHYDNNYTLTGGIGELNRRNGDLQFKAHLTGNFLGESVETDTLFAGSVGEYDYKKLETSFWDTNFFGRIQFYNIFVTGADKYKRKYEPWEILCNKDNAVVYFNGGPEDSLVAEIKRDGIFYFDFAPPLPLHGHIEGKANAPYVEVKVDNVYLNLELLNPLIASEYFVIKSGTAEGNLTITGSIADPQFYGLLEIKNGSVATKISPDIIKPINTTMSFQKKELKVTNSKTYLGKAPAEVYALLAMNNWLPSQYTLNIKTSGTQGLHLTFPVSMVKIDGYFLSSNFKLIGDGMSLKTEGEILLPQCNVTLSNLESQVEEESDYLYFVDLALKTGRYVEFTWPSRGFPIIQAVIKQNTDVIVHYSGSSEEFFLKGDVDLQGGEVFYFNRSFMVKSGTIFLRENEKRFDPVISLEAERREQLKGKDLKIYLTLKNQYLSQFEPHFSSEPPLASEYEILAALGGIFQDQNIEENVSAFNLALDLGSDILTQFWVLRPFEKAVKDILNVDVFSIRTQIVRNILVDRVFTTNAGVSQTDDLEQKNILANTTINLGQYIGNKNDLYFEMLVRFQSEENTTTDYESITSSENVIVESEFSLELTTPFFLTIKWTITPEHWESFFLPDNKITLKWGFTF